MNSVYFACITEFHLLVSFILAATTYSNQKKTLLLSKNPRLDQYIDRVSHLPIWDNVIIIDATDPADIVSKQITEILEDVSVLHFFSWGFTPFNTFFGLCHRRGIRIILTDEGIGTYMPYKRYNAWLNVRPENKLYVEGFDLKAVNEIWLLEPKLYLDDSILPLEKISLDAFYDTCKENKQVVEAFNRLFPYPSETSINYDLIYFRQYLYVYGYLSEFTDAFIDSFILKLIQNYNYCVKNHPALINDLYERESTELTINYPWEVFIITSKINESYDITLPKIYISPTSSGMFNSCTLGVPGVYIFLYKLVERYTDHRDLTIDEFIEHNRRIFPKATFYVPENWNEFQSLLEDAAIDLRIPGSKYSINIPFYENSKLTQNLIADWDIVRKQSNELFEKSQEISKLSWSVSGYTQAYQSIEKQLQQMALGKTALEKQLQEMISSKSAVEKQLQQMALGKTALEKQLQEMVSSKSAVEKQLQQMALGKTALEKQLQEMVSSKSAVEKQLQGITVQTSKLEDEIHAAAISKTILENELQQVTSEKQNLENQLHEITISKAWKAAIKLRTIRVKLFPEDSLQFRVLRFFWRLMRTNSS